MDASIIRFSPTSIQKYRMENIDPNPSSAMEGALDAFHSKDTTDLKEHQPPSRTAKG